VTRIRSFALGRGRGFGVVYRWAGDAPGTNRLEITGDRGKIVAEDGKITFHRTEESASKFLKEWPNGFGSPGVWTCDVPPARGDGIASPPLPPEPIDRRLLTLMRPLMLVLVSAVAVDDRHRVRG